MTRITTLLAVLMLMIGTALGVAVFLDPEGGGSGSLEITVGGATMEDAYLDSLTVTFSKARVYQDDGWTETVMDDTPVDLTELGENGTGTIANLTLEEGDYDKVELYVDQVTAMVDGEEVEVFVPSGKLKVVGGFSVDSDASATFEFDIRLVKRGNQEKYNIIPVIGKRAGPDKDDDKGKDDDDKKGNSNKGQLRLAYGKSKTDIGDFDHLNVTFYKARVFQIANNSTESNWTEIELDNVTVDLTNLTATNETIVANLSLDAGNYTKVELYVSDVLGIIDGDEVEVFVPSGNLKVVGAFEVKANETAEFTFDIDVVQRGKRAIYNLLPVIAKNQGDEDDD